MCVPPAEDGDYWRLLNPGTHILTATAKGYSRVSKRVRLPHNMLKAGVVDFVLKKVQATLCHVFCCVQPAYGGLNGDCLVIVVVVLMFICNFLSTAAITFGQNHSSL